MEGHWNTTFKRPTAFPPRRLRSPSPPRAYIEPLSPSKATKPRPIEPSFNYPPINNHVNFQVHPEQAVASTPRQRAQSASYKSGHHRTPSTIDTLAEAALAVSPSYQSHSRSSSIPYQPNGYGYASSPAAVYETGEPPHKRSRSELYPSPQIGSYVSRPATSYEYLGSRYNPGQAAPAKTYETRVEEAALLLNFRTGGWPSNGMSPPQVPVQPTHRPHANSFPQSSYHHKLVEASTHTDLPASLKAQEVHESQHAVLSSPQTHMDLAPVQGSAAATAAAPTNDVRSNDVGDVEMIDVALADSPDAGDSEISHPRHAMPNEIPARAESTDVPSSEASEATKPRRGWPKGKPRGTGARKTIADKVATKRVAARKKTPDAKCSKKPTPALASDLLVDEVKTRRKSFSDTQVSHGSLDFIPTTRAASVPRDVQMSIGVSASQPPRRQVKITPDTVCAGCTTSREKATASSEMDEWISCNGCKRWFHIDCAGFKKVHDIRDVDKYFCSTCEPEHGKTTYVRKSGRAHAAVDYAELQRGVLKTSEDSNEHHYIQPIKDGTFQFEPESFPRMRPEMVTREFFERSGAFVEPICIPAEWNPRPWNERAGKSADYEKAAEAGLDADEAMADLHLHDFEYDSVPEDGQDKLDMVMPQGLTVRQVCNLVGPDTPLDVIDVKTQNSGAKWNLSRWADYYEEEGAEKPIRNVISLEVSQTKLARLLRRPQIVRDIDLQDSVWPQEELDKGKWPKVQFYCLMSVVDSYTDFHIDFGGSSVYYHILKGKKTFFFIPPKPKHLKAYEDWNESPQQNFTFLPSITQECYRVDLSEGDTMLIPSGWIHAVWTPETSLVIGGNFLTRMSYKNQFKVVEIEKANHTPIKFRYPFFQKIMWYTAIQYLQEDPLPPAVSQLFYEGRKFERQAPIWQDFDGEIAANDDRPGAQNARYYSQAELDGLPEVVNFIFRTVMIVLGRVEGTSADQMKRVNASIPKGHGEPLEVAKTFALWVAWKRGNEDPPAWAHPDALLNPIKEQEGPPKKLSSRALKDMERKEAFAAWKVAPDRQSERVMSKMAAVASSTNGASASPAPLPSHQPGPQRQPRSSTLPSQHHHAQTFAHQHAPPNTSPGMLTMIPMTGQYLSTPKTSVLGPKRVACDACRKRRIRCKHKDMVMQVHLEGSPGGSSPAQMMGAFQSSMPGAEYGDNITVTPPRPRGEFVANGDASVNGMHDEMITNGHGPLPGTNAYVNANIPMTMNGVPIFGEVPKRGRSKACFECRKSKRRCVHDESGNVDPIKAAETPVPRGSVATKKRSIGEDGSPMQSVKKVKPENENQPPPPPPVQGGTAGILMPSNYTRGGHRQTSKKPPPPAAPLIPNGLSPNGLPPPVINEPPPEQPEIDPNLFAYPEPDAQGPYANHSYPYPTSGDQQNIPNYEFQSLEAIANEVLDMNGRAHEVPGMDFIDAQLNAPRQPEPHEYPSRQTNGGHVHVYKPTNDSKQADGSVDSAVSFRSNSGGERSVDDRLREAFAADEPVVYHGLPPPQPGMESSAQLNGHATLPSTESSHAPQIDINALPLYKPPAPPSQSPEMTRREPAMPVINGTKRRSESMSAPETKKARLEYGASGQGLESEDERLARRLQEEDRGLRER